MSIFKEYYTDQKFVDRYSSDSSGAVDVIIPVYHTNELWQKNLVSIYREVPVKRLLISDGGVIDDSIDIVSKFPRVEIFDHRKYKTLGKCIAELIKEVTAEWFIYLHSDVYLPEGWFNKMIKYQSEFDWYGCPMNITALINYRLDEPLRPYAGSQMGKKLAFSAGIDIIDDDYVYRQEDFIFNRIVEDAGYKNGKVEETFHYHQLMYRQSQGFDINVSGLHVETKTNDKEKRRSLEMQIKGIVKYLDPIEIFVIKNFSDTAFHIILNNQLSFSNLRTWVAETNYKWLPYLNYTLLIKVLFKKITTKARGLFIKIITKK